MKKLRTVKSRGVKAVYEIVIDGIDEKSVAAAMGAGIKAAVQVPGVKFISAGNFGGTLDRSRSNFQTFFNFSFFSAKWNSIYSVIAD